MKKVSLDMGSAYWDAGGSWWVSFCRIRDATIPTYCDRCPATSQGRTEGTGATDAFPGNIDVAKVRFLEWEEMTDDQKLARGMLQLYRWNSLQNIFSKTIWVYCPLTPGSRA